MKLKQSPDDFRVDEITSVVADAIGPFSLYRLEKCGWTTPDALAIVRQRWRIDSRRMSFGGLKDRHAATTQHFTIKDGPQRNLIHGDIRVIYLGAVHAPFAASEIAANRFHIVLRALTAAQANSAIIRYDEVRAVGMPNYFDDQRFGSFQGEFIGRLMVRGQYEEALKLALTGPYEFDKARAKRVKAIIREYWGRWDECLARLDRAPARELIEFLQERPGDFRGAVARLWPESQGLYLAAYQSFIWNRMLAALLGARLDSNRLIDLPTKLGPLPAPQTLSPAELADLAQIQLPLPSARLRRDPDAFWSPLVDQVLEGEGFCMEEMKLPGLRKPFFSKGNRQVLVRPERFSATAQPDEKNSGTMKLLLAFELPRGSYATILVKRISILMDEC